MALLSFNNDPAIKEKYIARVRAHAAADEIIKGIYWEDGKGCAVGCTIHSPAHNAYETELGLPEWLARLEDGIFEGLPNQEAKTFPLEFLEAIPVGVDVEPVKSRFLYWLMLTQIEQVQKLELELTLKTQVLDAIRQCQALHVEDAEVNESAWSAARSAARSAWSAARSAAWSAARSDAWSAARSARSAESAARSDARSDAWSAAWSAESAARSDARSDAWSAAYVTHRDKLLELLRAL